MIYPKPFYVGFAGTAKEMFAVGDFYTYPDSFEEAPKIETDLRGLVLTEDRKIFMFDSGLRWLEIKEPFGSIGSGCMFAKGAMASGKTPKEAIQIAIKHDPFTGYGVKVFNFK